MSKKQRFSKYTPLLLVLPINEIHTPSTITTFAQSIGLLSYFHPGQEDKVARQRIRIALGLFSRNNGFPDEGDAILESRGQIYQGWYSWRWQRMSSAEEARAQLNQRVKPLLDALNPGALYQESDIYAIWNDIPLEKTPYSFKRGRPNWETEWVDMHDIIIKYSLASYAGELGLDPKRAYDSETWRKGLSD